MLIQNNNRQNIANAALISSHVPLKSANSFILPQKSEIEIRTNENTFGQQKSANKSNAKSANKNSKSVAGKKATSKAKQGCKENQAFTTLKENDTALPTKKTLRTATTVTFNQVIDETRRSFIQPRTALNPCDPLVKEKAKTLSALTSPLRATTALATRNEREDLTRASSVNLQQVSSAGTLTMCRCQLTQVAATYSVEDILSGAVSTSTLRTDEMIKYRDYMNCKQCGAFAFKPENNLNSSQYCYAFKLKEDRQRVDISPQQILHQLRQTADQQHQSMQGQYFNTCWYDIRRMMLQLICEVGDCLKQSQLTIHLAVNYLDRFLSAKNKIHPDATEKTIKFTVFREHSLDAVAITCLLLASKFDEIDDNIPLISEFTRSHAIIRDSLQSEVVSSFDKRSTNLTYNDITKCELSLLNILKWSLNTLTPLHFIQNYVFQGIVFSNDTLAQSDNMISPDRNGQTKIPGKKTLQKVKRYIDYFALQSLKQDFMLDQKFKIDVIAVAIIRGARKASKIEPDWNVQALEGITGVSQSEVQECFNILYSAFDSSFQCKPEPVQLEVYIPLNEDKVDRKDAETDNHQIELLEIPLDDPNAKATSNNQNSALNGVLSTGCMSNDNSGTIVELQNFRQKAELSHQDHLALSVEIIENTQSSDANLETKEIDENSTHDKSEHLDVPKQLEVFNNENTKSSGASFSSHSLERKQYIPESKIAFSTVCLSSCSQVNVIKAVTQAEPVKVTGNRLRDRSTGKQIPQLRKQVSSGIFNTIEPLKEFKERPTGPIQVFKQTSKEHTELKVFSASSRRSTSVTKGIFRQRSISQISDSGCAFIMQPIAIQQQASKKNGDTVKIVKYQNQLKQKTRDSSVSSCNQRSVNRAFQTATPRNLMPNKPQASQAINANKYNGQRISQRDTIQLSNQKNREPSFLKKSKSFVAGNKVTYQSRLKRTASSNIVSIQNQKNAGDKNKQTCDSSISTNNKRGLATNSELISKKTDENTTDLEQNSSPNVLQRYESKDKYDCQREVRFSSNPRIINQESSVNELLPFTNVSINPGNIKEQNFIQKNKIYINQLNQKAKEKKQNINLSRTNSQNNISTLAFKKQSSTVEKYTGEHLKGSFLQNGRKLVKQGSESVTNKYPNTRQQYLTVEFSNQPSTEAKTNDKSQITFAMNSRETSQTPTPTGVSERPSTSSSQLQYNTSKLFQKKSKQQVIGEGPKESQPKTFFHKFKPPGHLASILKEEEMKENLTLSVIESIQQDNFFSETFAGVKPEVIESSNKAEVTTANGTFTNGAKRPHNHQKPTKSSIQRAKSGYMQRKESNVGNTFATAATTRAPQEPSATPGFRFSKYVIGNQPQQVRMPNNLNHLVSPTFAAKKGISRQQSKLAPEKAKSRNSPSKLPLAEAKSQRVGNFESTISKTPALETESIEPIIATSTTTRNQTRMEVGQFTRQGKQSVGKPTKTGNFGERKQSAGMPKQQLQAMSCNLAAQRYQQHPKKPELEAADTRSSFKIQRNGGKSAQMRTGKV